jgi:hypothetical protein
MFQHKVWLLIANHVTSVRHTYQQTLRKVVAGQFGIFDAQFCNSQLQNCECLRPCRPLGPIGVQLRITVVLVVSIHPLSLEQYLPTSRPSSGSEEYVVWLVRRTGQWLAEPSCTELSNTGVPLPDANVVVPGSCTRSRGERDQ